MITSMALQLFPFPASSCARESESGSSSLVLYVHFVGSSLVWGSWARWHPAPKPAFLWPTWSCWSQVPNWPQNGYRPTLLVFSFGRYKQKCEEWVKQIFGNTFSALLYWRWPVTPGRGGELIYSRLVVHTWMTMPLHPRRLDMDDSDALFTPGGWTWMTMLPFSP